MKSVYFNVVANMEELSSDTIRGFTFMNSRYVVDECTTHVIIGRVWSRLTVSVIDTLQEREYNNA